MSGEPSSLLLVEYRAAQKIMMLGNLETSAFAGLIKDKNVVFFAGEIAEFKRCNHCSAFPDEHPENFLRLEASALQTQGDLALVLGSKGILTSRNHGLLRPMLQFAAIAACSGASVVLTPSKALIDKAAICSAATVPTVTVEAFIEVLKKTPK